MRPMTQVERLRILAQWIKNEIDTANLYDLETIRALKSIITPIADALNIDATPRNPGPTEHVDVIVLTVVHDNDRGGYWGTCEACGIISIICDDTDDVLNCVGLHMARFHPSCSLALAHEEVVP